MHGALPNGKGARVRGREGGRKRDCDWHSLDVGRLAWSCVSVQSAHFETMEIESYPTSIRISHDLLRLCKYIFEVNLAIRSVHVYISHLARFLTAKEEDAECRMELIWIFFLCGIEVNLNVGSNSNRKRDRPSFIERSRFFHAAWTVSFVFRQWWTRLNCRDQVSRYSFVHYTGMMDALWWMHPNLVAEKQKLFAKFRQSSVLVRARAALIGRLVMANRRDNFWDFLASISSEYIHCGSLWWFLDFSMEHWCLDIKTLNNSKVFITHIYYLLLLRAIRSVNCVRAMHKWKHGLLLYYFESWMRATAAIE